MNPDKTLQQFMREMDIDLTLRTPPVDLNPKEHHETRVMHFDPQTKRKSIFLTEISEQQVLLNPTPAANVYEQYALGEPVAAEVLGALLDRYFEQSGVAVGGHKKATVAAYCQDSGAINVWLFRNEEDLVKSILVVTPPEVSLGE